MQEKKNHSMRQHHSAISTAATTTTVRSTPLLLHLHILFRAPSTVHVTCEQWRATLLFPGLDSTGPDLNALDRVQLSKNNSKNPFKKI